MVDLFDSTNYPEPEPDELIAGDRWVWKRTDLGADYHPDSYSLTYSLRLEGDGTDEIEITANEDGQDYLVEVASATTAAYTAGRYHWQAYITRSSDSERITVDRGVLEVIADRDESTADPRSHVKKTLDALEATIEGRATKADQGYTIEGRSLSRMSMDELIRAHGIYQAKYNAELAKKRAERGLGAGNKVRVRFPDG